MDFSQHPKFEGHVTLNEDEYQKSVRKNETGLLSWSIIIHRWPMVFWLHASADFEIGRFRNFRTSVPCIWIRWYCIPSFITHRPPLAYSRINRKNFLDGRTDGRKDI